MRYIVLIVLNLPIILIALLNIITRYKIKKISKSRYYTQLIMWLMILIILLGSFPIYNLLTNRPVLDSITLSSFDIIQTTAIVYLIYFINDQRQKIDEAQRRLRDLHQELSIKISSLNEKKR
jgi:hypothetical protein